MSVERTRYVEVRANANGTTRYYWSRKGHRVRRLSEDSAKRFQQQLWLNQRADAGETATLPDDEAVVIHNWGSLGWLCDQWEKNELPKRKKGTQRWLRQWLREVRALGEATSFKFFEDYELVRDFITGFNQTGGPQKAKTVLSHLFMEAMKHRVVKTNTCLLITLTETEDRHVFWEPGEIETWLETARHHAHSETMRISMALLRNTAQRFNDCLGLKRTAYDGEKIKLRQEKTNHVVWVPASDELKLTLDPHLKTWDGPYIVPHFTHDRCPYVSASKWFKEVCDLAGLENKQLRDLRRTAAVRMSEAGATHQQVAAVGGWSIGAVADILDTYIPRTYEMARGGIAALNRANEKGLTPPADSNVIEFDVGQKSVKR